MTPSHRQHRAHLSVGLLTLTVLALALITPVRAREPFRYPEGKHGKGELKYLNGLPVLQVVGTPEEIGNQVGELTVKPAAKLLAQPEKLLKDQGLEKVYPVLLRTAAAMVPRFPPDHLKELGAIAKVSGHSRDVFLFANTMPDLLKIGGCSTLIVESDRSATGAPIFGRNLDWPPSGGFNEYTLVTVYRPKGKHAFVSIGYPGLVGCLSGMNDTGLAVAVLESYASGDGASSFNPSGTPYMLYIRRILEECTTVEEAEKLLRSVKRTTMHNLAVCDRKHGAVFEITPKTVARRSSEKGFCACTNHFRTDKLTTSKECRRYKSLEKSDRDVQKFTIADVAKQLHAVNQGEYTLQTMVFEPAALKLHLAFGDGPSSRLPLKMLELKKLLAPAEDKDKERMKDEG